MLLKKNQAASKSTSDTQMISALTEYEGEN